MGENSGRVVGHTVCAKVSVGGRMSVHGRHSVTLLTGRYLGTYLVRSNGREHCLDRILFPDMGTGVAKACPESAGGWR